MSDADYEDVIKRLVEIKKQIDEMLVCLDGAVVMGIYIKSRAFRMSATCQKGVIHLIPRMSALY